MNASTVATAAFLTSTADSLYALVFNGLDSGLGRCEEMTDQQINESIIDIVRALRTKGAELTTEVETFEKAMAPKARPFISTSDLALEAAERDRGERDARDWFYGVRMM